MALKVCGIKAINKEQQEALEALTDPSISLVILESCAGSGKSLLAIAAGLHQVLVSKLYNKVIWTRAPIPVGQDIGFAPGNIEEKLAPWAGALYDNLEVIKETYGKITDEIIQDRIKLVALMHMRGRSLQNKYVIIDEGQNITPNQIKTLITRAGEGSKIVLLGDVSQIDNKGLNIENNALTYVMDRVGFESFIKVVELPTSERSELCTWATEKL